MSVNYSFNDKNEFVIDDYDKASTFASFLPGIAGIDGIPMWCFYVNRGQCVGSFGVKDKDNAIMEFFPANTMYKNIELQGFRTFIKYKEKIHEIFSSTSQDKYLRRMIIEKNVLKIEEINETINIKIIVTYFNIAHDSYSGIARKVSIFNLDKEAKEIEILDGAVQILPFGISNSEYQSMSNLSKAWFQAENKDDILYYKLRATMGDTSEIGKIEGANFYLAFSSKEKNLKPIYDMDLIFGYNTSFTYPSAWNTCHGNLVSLKQISENKVSGGFANTKFTLKEEFYLGSILGYTPNPELISKRKNEFDLEYINSKEEAARKLAEALTEKVLTKTSNRVFDEYVSQCFLDNLLRGGYPIIFKAKDREAVYHIYSRKHGDLEREYNFFSTEPHYYSQGNGNFRDVNQNRRNDVYIEPLVKDFNVRQFMNLIQADGYNPLLVKGSTFTYKGDNHILSLVLSHKGEIEKILKDKFTPGRLISFIVNNKVEMSVTKEEFLEAVIKNSSQNFEAEFGEGYWNDHFTYNMDLIESYLDIYPDKLEELLFQDRTYRYFDSPIRLLKKREKYVYVNGKVRQYDSIIEDKEKIMRLGIKANETNWLRDEYGKGEIYETNLFSKLVSLALNKFICLDPNGIGIEMEANKPGWNDAMNGLPGLFGSSIGETAELIRILEFIISASEKFQVDIKLTIEMKELLFNIEKLVDLKNKKVLTDFAYWEAVGIEKENYRDKIRFGINGEESSISTKVILNIFLKFQRKLQEALRKATDYGQGIYPTYLVYEAQKYDVLESSNPVNGYKNVVIKEFKCTKVPLFLEAPARILKNIKDIAEAKLLYNSVKQSSIYDRKLRMYKTSESLESMSEEIGRVRAFTPGWLERESIFLHMEYKYFLAMLEAGLYDEFYEEIKVALVPFMNPKIYGRSILENSSFIASSENPDDSIHGRGFVARLSGSTAELLSMWHLMMCGKKVFSYDNNKLELRFKPILSKDFFDADGKVAFKFLGHILVTYHNPARSNTYGSEAPCINNILITLMDGNKIQIKNRVIEEPYSVYVRNGLIQAIDVYFDNK